MAKSIIITGATGNLGKVVLNTLKEKYNILAPIRSDKDIELVSDEKAQAAVIRLDQQPEVNEYVEAHAEDLAGAVLTVGGFAMGGFQQTEIEDINKMIFLNFTTVYPLVKSMLPALEKNGGGQIVLIGARPALDPKAGSGLVAYSLSKGLIFQLSEMINAYGKGKNITSTVIVPSIIDTPPNRESMPDADFSQWITTQSIADAIDFIFSDSGSKMREGVIKMYNNS